MGFVRFFALMAVTFAGSAVLACACPPGATCPDSGREDLSYLSDMGNPRDNGEVDSRQCMDFIPQGFRAGECYPGGRGGATGLFGTKFCHKDDLTVEEYASNCAPTLQQIDRVNQLCQQQFNEAEAKCQEHRKDAYKNVSAEAMSIKNELAENADGASNEACERNNSLAEKRKSEAEAAADKCLEKFDYCLQTCGVNASFAIDAADTGDPRCMKISEFRGKRDMLAKDVVPACEKKKKMAYADALKEVEAAKLSMKDTAVCRGGTSAAEDGGKKGKAKPASTTAGNGDDKKEEKKKEEKKDEKKQANGQGTGMPSMPTGDQSQAQQPTPPEVKVPELSKCQKPENFNSEECCGLFGTCAPKIGAAPESFGAPIGSGAPMTSGTTPAPTVGSIGPTSGMPGFDPQAAAQNGSGNMEGAMMMGGGGGGFGGGGSPNFKADPKPAKARSALAADILSGVRGGGGFGGRTGGSFKFSSSGSSGFATASAAGFDADKFLPGAARGPASVGDVILPPNAKLKPEEVAGLSAEDAALHPKRANLFREIHRQYVKQEPSLMSGGPESTP